MLRFPSVRAFRDRLLGLSCVTASLWAACSVFPDEALLPPAAGGSASGESGLPAEGGASASAGEPSVVPAGGAGRGGAAGSSGGSGGDAGESTTQAGAGGVPAPTCESPQEHRAQTNLDLWVGSLAPSANHGGEGLLYVSGGADERRSLFALELPAALPGAVLLRAEVVLRLESNADASQAARRLGLRALTPPRAVREDKASWTHFAQGNNNTWATAGGDLGELVSEAELAPGTSSGAVRFDVTEAVRALLTSEPKTYGVAVLELGSAPAPPAELAFTSREGNASESPLLLLSYCQP